MIIEVINSSVEGHCTKRCKHFLDKNLIPSGKFCFTRFATPMFVD